MAMPKNPALFIMSLLAALLLTGCGGQPLSKREIVRAVFFERQGSGYSVCLLLRGLDVDAALRWRSAFTWGFVILAWIGGAAAWLCRKIRRCS